MYGINVITKQETGEWDGKIGVTDIWYTLQGEGPFAGEPAVFVRLMGCNLRCQFCDQQFDSGSRMLLDHVYSEMVRVSTDTDVVAPDAPPIRFCVITGGEPLLQQGFVPLVLQLWHQGWRVQVETAGTVFPENFGGLMALGRLYGNELTIVCSPKTPKISDRLVPYVDHWKYIIVAGRTAGDDGLPVGNYQRRDDGAGEYSDSKVFRPTNKPVWVSPCDENDPIKNQNNLLEAARVAARHGYRVTVQMHKLIGIP